MIDIDKKKSKRPAGVIEIASNSIKLHIAQNSKNEDTFIELENVELPLGLGYEVLETGKVSYDTFHDISRKIKGFLNLLRDYGVSNYRIVATSALRGASNKTHVTDHLFIQNNVSLEILDENSEKTLIYNAMLNAIRKNGDCSTNNTLLSYIGTGSLGVSHCVDGKIDYSQNMNLGSLRLGDMLQDLELETDIPYLAVEEYLENALELTLRDYSCDAKNLFVCGNDIKKIALLTNSKLKNGVYRIKKKNLRELYEKIRSLSINKLALEYQLSLEQAEILYAEVVIYIKLSETTNAHEIIAPSVSLSDAILETLLDNSKQLNLEKHINDGILASCSRIAKQYNSNIKHCETVAKLSTNIFDRLKKIHGLTNHERLLLQISSKLHDCGYFVNTKNHHLSSYYLIKNSNIYGLSEPDISLVAQIIHCDEPTAQVHNTPDFFFISEQNRLLVSKLAVILRISNALDKSHKNKIVDISVKLSTDKMIVTAVSDDDINLEKWAFKECSHMFKDVFGITPELNIKRNLLK